MLTSALLAGVPHGFSTRAGLEAGDVLPGARLVRLRQVHSAHVETVEGPWPGDPPEGDALVTATPGLLLAIVTADCVPVLLCDPAAGVVGAAHAGWRGALAGVLGNTVAAMAALGAQAGRIRAVIGPAIAGRSYEVDDGLRAKFIADDAANARFFSPGAPGHYQFDLPAYAAARLVAAGVGTVADLGEDTYSQPDRFHSFRRATHRGEAAGGRQISAIARAG